MKKSFNFEIQVRYNSNGDKGYIAVNMNEENVKGACGNDGVYLTSDCSDRDFFSATVIAEDEETAITLFDKECNSTNPFRIS